MTKKRDLKRRIAELEAENEELRRQLDIERQMAQIIRIKVDPPTITIPSPSTPPYIYERKPGDPVPQWWEIQPGDPVPPIGPTTAPVRIRRSWWIS